MNKRIQKKELFLLLSLSSIIATPTIKANTLTQTPSSQALISETENQFIEDIVKKVSYYIVHLEKEVKRFLDTKDKNPYSKHVDGFHHMLQNMHTDIVAPVAQELQRPSHSSYFYTEVISETNTIVQGLYNTLESLYKMLNANRGTTDLQKMAGEFKKLQENLKSQLNSLLPHIQKLQGSMTQKNPALALKVGEFATDLTRALNSKGGNPLELLSKIHHRMKCR
jgi:hypothetical protein